MDAAQFNFKKFAFFIALALLLMAPVHGYAQPFLKAASTTVTIGSSDCNKFQNVLVTSNDGSTLAFSVKVQYNVGDQFGSWLYAKVDAVPGSSTPSGLTNGGASFATDTGVNGTVVQIGLNSSIGAVTPSATVVITPANATAAVPITVFYTQNTSCGGNTGQSSNGFLTVAPGNVALTAGLGSSQSQNLTIQNATGSGLTFGFSTQGGTWLTASATSNSISPNGTAIVTVTGDGSKLLATGTVQGIVTITPQSGFGTALLIPVTFVVTNGTGGGGTGGTLTLGGAVSNTFSTSFSYVKPDVPGASCIPIQDTAAAASSYNYQVSTTGGGNWLLANFNLSGNTVGLLAPSSAACVTISLSNIASSLPSGSYQGSVALTSSSGSTATINVSLFVSAGTAPGISVNPGSIFNFGNVAVGAVNLQQQVFQITAQPGYVLGAPIASSSPGWFTMTNPTASGSVETFTVTASPAGLITGLYSVTVTVTSSGTSAGTTTILITLPVGQAGATTGGGGNTGTTLVAPSSLAFQQQAGNTLWTGGQEAQTITMTGAQGTQWSASIVYGNGGSNWLNFTSPCSGVPCSGTFGTGPTSLVLDLFNGVQNLVASSTPYSATLNITSSAGTSNVNVTLLVTPTNTPVLLGRPALVTFASNGGVVPGNQTVQVVGSDNFNSPTSPSIQAGTPSVTWVTAATSGNTLTLTVNPAGQTTGIYSGVVPVTASSYANLINYPVVLVVNGGGGGTSSGPLTLSTTSIAFSGVTAQVSQTLNITATGSTSVTATASEQTCTSSTWLAISPGGAITASNVNTPIAVTANPSGIANGTTCTGAISLQTASANQTVSVTMSVGAATGAGNVTVSPLTMTFAYAQNQTVPPAQTATIVNQASGTAGIPFTVSAAVAQSVGNWLQISATSGTTPANSPGLSVSVVPNSLQPGTYQGTVTITPTGGTAQVINVSLTVTGTAVVTATPTTLSLSYLVGGASPTATIQVSGGGATAAFTAVASSSGWLKVSPTSGTTPNTGTANLSVTLDPTVLATLVPGPYTGTITVTGTSPASGTTIVNVTLNITAPLPTITGVTNAASGASGAIAPGEIISIFANSANPIGPPIQSQLDSTTCPSPCTSVPTTMGSVTVTFLPIGVKAPLIFVTAGQINAVVPYQVAGITNLSVQVKYLGQTSNAWPLTSTTTAPGIFSQNQSGSGPGAVVMYDATGAFKGTNTVANPAARGWFLVIYMTGEGTVTPGTPAALTGSVTPATPPIPQPLFAPTVLIDGQPATVSGYAEAPGFVSGLLQVNAIVPQTVRSGPVTLSVSIGSGSSQAGITVAIQ